jgi:hypothetical protein
MARPIDPKKYIHGEPCRKCGTTLRYKGPQKRCVECERLRNARKRRHTASRRAVEAERGDPPPFAPHGERLRREQQCRKLAYFQQAYAGTLGARARGAHLDSLIGKKPDAERPAPVCGGDLHRASLKVGAELVGAGVRGPKLSQASADTASRAERERLHAALRAIWDSLPDTVTLGVVTARLPEDVVGINPFRFRALLASALRECGAQTLPDDPNHVREYQVREAAKPAKPHRPRRASKKAVERARSAGPQHTGKRPAAHGARIEPAA